MRNQIQQLNNNINTTSYQLILPLDIGIKIESTATVRLLLEITERMDYSKLEAAYKRLPRGKEASPKQMFQLTVLGFMEKIYSTRRLESACKHDIRFMYILGGKPAPDHNRFWKFIKHRLQGDVAEHLFYQLVEYLGENTEIDFTNLFVDGTKIEAQANRYSFVWKKSTNKYEARLDEKMNELLRQLHTAYSLLIPAEPDPTKYLELLKAHAKNTTFIYGRGKRKSQIQRDVEALEAFVLRKGKYTSYNSTFNGRNSFSKTDPDATFMRMKDDHMRNGQLKPAYNLTLGVEGEYIVGINLSSKRSDEWTLLPLLDRMEKGLGKRHKNITGDAGFESEENYKGLQQRNQIAYIKPQNYERSKTRKYKSNAFLRENMLYDSGNDTYTCPNGNTFSPIYITKRHSKSGFESEVTVYECYGCNECPSKSDCTRAKGNRKITVSKDFQQLRTDSRERITSDYGKLLRTNRSIQVEGAFGVLKQDYGFRRFLRRGQSNVFTETILYAVAFNINKLHNKKNRKLQGVTLHLINSS